MIVPSTKQCLRLCENFFNCIFSDNLEHFFIIFYFLRSDCNRNDCGYYLYLSSLVHIDNPETLRLLIEQNRLILWKIYFKIDGRMDLLIILFVLSFGKANFISYNDTTRYGVEQCVGRRNFEWFLFEVRRLFRHNWKK